MVFCMGILNGDYCMGILIGDLSRIYLRGLTWIGNFAWGFYMGILHGGFKLGILYRDST